MSISKQLSINRFRLPVELLDIIKEFAFYDIKTFQAKKCVYRICTMINEGNKSIRNLILHLFSFKTPILYNQFFIKII